MYVYSTERGIKRKEIKQERKTEQNRLQINLLRELFSDEKVKEFSIQIFTLKKITPRFLKPKSHSQVPPSDITHAREIGSINITE